MQLSDLSATDENERNEYLERLHFDSIRTVYRYLHIGWYYAPPLILDWSSMVFAVNHHKLEHTLVEQCALYVSYFPAEQQALFFFYEAYDEFPQRTLAEKYAGFRLSSLRNKWFASESDEATELFAEIQRESDNVLIMIRNFWATRVNKHGIEEAHISELQELSYAIESIDSRLKNALKMYPNDSHFASTYAHFLLETMVDVEEGTFTKLKSGHLEKGLHASVDPMFRSFVIALPHLIRLKIVDKKGNIRRSAFELTSNTTTTMTISTTAMEKLEEDLDQGLADQMIEDMYQWPNLRKSISRATQKYHPRLANWGYFSLILTAIIFFAFMIACIVIVYTICDEQIEISERFDMISEMRTEMAMARLNLALDWAKANDLVYNQELFEATMPEKVYNEHLNIKVFGDLNDQLRSTLMKTITHYSNLMRQLAFKMSVSTSEQNTDLILAFCTDALERDRCKSDGSIASQAKISMMSAIPAILTEYHIVASDMKANAKDYGNHFAICESYKLQNGLIEADEHLVDLSLGEIDKESESSYVELVILLGVSIGLFIITIPFLALPYIIYIRDAKQMYNALNSIDSAAAKAASQLLLLEDQSNSNSEATESVISKTSANVYLLIVVISAICAFAALIAYFIVSMNQVESLHLLCVWRARDCMLPPVMLEGTAQIVLSLAAKIVKAHTSDTSAPWATDTQAMYDLGLSYVEKLLDQHTSFYIGDDKYDGIKGKYSLITDLHSKDSCKESSSDTHEFYSCLAIERLLNSFHSYAINMEQITDLQDEHFIHFIHLSTCELLNILRQSISYVVDEIDSSTLTQKLISVFMVVLILLLYAVMIIMIQVSIGKAKHLIYAALVLIRRLPPAAIAESKVLSKILLGNRIEDDYIEKSHAEIVFENLPTATICISDNGTIETMNNAAKQLLGFLQGQIIGQHICSLIQRIDEQTADNDQLTATQKGTIDFYNCLEQMSKPDCKEFTYSMPVECQCADESSIIVNLDVYGVIEYNGQASNVIIFIKDVRESMKLDADIAKTMKSVEKLKDQLIPRDVHGFIRGERQGFTFNAPSTTALCVCIDGFYEKLEAAENKQEVLNSLYNVFQSVEAECFHNPPMMKNRSFSDFFVAIGGIFGEQNHALAAYSTALAVQSLNLDFKVKIGIVTGGPLICAIIEETFSASGAHVELAAALAGVCQPGRILIMEDVVSAIGESAKDLEPGNPPEFNGKKLFSPKIDEDLIDPEPVAEKTEEKIENAQALTPKSQEEEKIQNKSTVKFIKK